MKTSMGSDEIPTPEKQIQLPRRASKRRLSFSVTDMRRIAVGLRRTRGQAGNAPDLLQFDGELQQKAGSFSELAPATTSARNSMKLPKNYEMLAEFFNCLDSSIRLLRLKGVSSTFINISSSIQHLTERRFTYKHLAQLKHILPESVSIKKVLLRDEATCCMKPELLVSLQMDALERNVEIKGEGASSTLRKVFRARLVQFFREHPEEDEIPEDALPHPFGYTKPSMSTVSNEPIPSILTGSVTAADRTNNITSSSHFPGSFQRRFSRKTPCSDQMQSHFTSLDGVAIKSDSSVPSSPLPVSIHNKSSFSSLVKRPLKMREENFEENSKILVSAQSSPCKGKMSLESTPLKEISTPEKLKIATPDLQAPKRKCNIIEDTPPKELMKRATKMRLFPTPRKNANTDDSVMSENSSSEDVLALLPESLLRDIKEKERKAMVERETNASGARLRKKMIASLPRLLNSILLIFQSGNRSVITKQELVHKILASHCSLVDRYEVEEQLELMQELVPDWISQKVSVTGDILYRLNNVSCTQEIRQRLAVAE